MSLYRLIQNSLDSVLLQLILISTVSQHRRVCKDKCSSWWCAVPLSSLYSQFQTIGGISHHRHHQHKACGRHLKAAWLVLLSPSLVSLTFCHCKGLMLSSQTCMEFHSWKILLYASSENKQWSELIKGETRQKLQVLHSVKAQRGGVALS